MHDFSADYGNYKIDLANPNAPCNANYKNYLDNYVENYKKIKDTITELVLAECTFPEERNPPQSDESITRHSQIIAGFSPVRTRIQNFLGRKGIVGFK
ncbi:PIR Superfamily Protein [Plasmodium ovale curtisi]|uniref:PIR Superfamily Protein n=1 Tax=Plasmodium ovale curtisi TaxID=864141 RepID=A0A1A8X462_PLAOA|nr:PIR Superfamily Protein [Plasmodium ovale curtisi]SBT00027.1 PIR Superfamily Protein [Plasmodium ovale curtisi]